MNQSRIQSHLLTFLLVGLLYVKISFAAAPAEPTTKSRNVESTDAPILNDVSMMTRIGASVMGESALIDKETGRIFWEGGSSTVSASISPVINEIGLRHFRATVLSILLAISLFSIISRNLWQPMEKQIGEVPRWQLLIVFAKWIVQRIPTFDNWFIATVIALYLLESYTCGTKRYLANAISSPDELEEYIERLRHEEPVVTWKVRCFHYERRWFAALFLPHVWKNVLRRSTAVDVEEDSNLISSVSSPSLTTKKVVTHRAEANYVYNSCQDNTIAGMWKKADATSSGENPPFSKITLTKLLILGNKKTREDYFKQQSDFVSTQGQSDEFAEFSTNIHVDGFRQRVLAVRPVEGVPSAKLFRLHLFWLFTFLGLTVPFRIWFARHCDELRVTVTKETSSDKSSSWGSKSWFSWSTSEAPGEAFRKMMQDLALYALSDKVLPDESGAEDDETEAMLADIQAASAAAKAFPIAKSLRAEELLPTIEEIDADSSEGE